MKLLIDSANLADIERLFSIYPVTGVTCNPSILKKEQQHPYAILEKIRQIMPPAAQLHIQVISANSEAMIREAYELRARLGSDIIIKIPVNTEGIKVIRALHRDGIKTTGTVVYSVLQGYLAALAGATYIAPYVNRIDNIGFDGVQVVSDLQAIFTKNNCKTEILAASFKNSQQVLEMVKLGVGAATLSPEVLDGLLKFSVIDNAIDQFRADFESLCGPDKTMLNI